MKNLVCHHEVRSVGLTLIGSSISESPEKFVCMRSCLLVFCFLSKTLKSNCMLEIMTPKTHSTNHEIICCLLLSSVSHNPPHRRFSGRGNKIQVGEFVKENLGELD